MRDPIHFDNIDKDQLAHLKEEIERIRDDMDERTDSHKWLSMASECIGNAMESGHTSVDDWE